MTPQDHTDDRDIFEIPQEILAIHKRMDSEQISLVRALGEAIGYGRLMQLAEQIWGEKEDGRGGEHTIGPCAAFMVPCEHWAEDDNGHCSLCCGAGRVTRGAAELARSHTTKPDIKRVVEKIEAEVPGDFGLNSKEFWYAAGLTKAVFIIREELGDTDE